MTSRAGRKVTTYILFDNMAIIQVNDYIYTSNCNLAAIRWMLF